MKPTKKYTFTLTANGVYRLLVAGDYFKVLSATGLVKVKGKWGELSGLVAGQGLENSDFDDLFFTDESAAPNTITVLVGDRNFIDGLTGQVSLDAPTLAALETIELGAATLAALENITATVANFPANQGAFTQITATVTTASAQLEPANAARRYLLVQNNDATGIVYVNLTGVAATAANGVKLLPGAQLEIQGYCPTAAINAIGSIASNTNVIVVEG